MPDTDVCRYWDCNVSIDHGLELCLQHRADSDRGHINDCPHCGRAKRVQHVACFDCYDSMPRHQQSVSTKAQSLEGGPKTQQIGPSFQKRDLEPAEASKKRASAEDQCFVYILTLDGGGFYAGHTRELGDQMSMHRDGHEPSTAGKHPRLVWFNTVPTQEEAVQYEVVLRQLVDSNPREVVRMVVAFHNLVGQLDTGE